MFCSKAEMEADTERLALQADGTPFEDGTECTVYKKGDYTAGSDTVFCVSGHWYDY